MYTKYNHKHWVSPGSMLRVWAGPAIARCSSVTLESVHGRLCRKNPGLSGETFNVLCAFRIGERIHWGSLINPRLIDCKLPFEVRYPI